MPFLSSKHLEVISFGLFTKRPHIGSQIYLLSVILVWSS